MNRRRPRGRDGGVEPEGRAERFVGRQARETGLRTRAERVRAAATRLHAPNGSRKRARSDKGAVPCRWSIDWSPRSCSPRGRPGAPTRIAPRRDGPTTPGAAAARTASRSPRNEVHVTPDGYLVTIPDGSHMHRPRRHQPPLPLRRGPLQRRRRVPRLHPAPGRRRRAARTCRAWASDGGRLILASGGGRITEWVDDRYAGANYIPHIAGDERQAAKLWRSRPGDHR